MSIGATLGGAWANLDIRILTDDELLARSAGSIAKPETINHRTLKPEPGGLFDPTVFSDFDDVVALLRAGMDVTWSPTAATSRFGHVELCQPIVHPYFATFGLSELARTSGLSNDDAASVLAQHLVYFDGELKPVAEVTHHDDLAYGAQVFGLLLPEPSRFLVRRVLIAPVAMRPMVRTESGWVTSHINDLYRRLINRHARLERLIELNAPIIILLNEQRMLQEAAEQLAFNGHRADKVVTGPDGEPLVSLFTLATRDAEVAAPALSGSGPARGVRAFRAFEAIGFGIGSAVQARPKAPSSVKVDFNLADSPVPIPT